MSRILTDKDQLTCPHQAPLKIISTQQVLTADTHNVLLLSDIQSATVTGCPQQVPCTQVLFASDPLGSAMTVGGQLVATDALQAFTLGGAVMVQPTQTPLNIQGAAVSGSSSNREATATTSSVSTTDENEEQGEPASSMKQIKELAWQRQEKTVSYCPPTHDVDLLITTKCFSSGETLKLEFFRLMQSGEAPEYLPENDLECSITSEHGEGEQILITRCSWTVPQTPRQSDDEPTASRVDSPIPYYFVSISHTDLRESGKSPLLQAVGLQNGYYFLPLVGISWIPFQPLLKEVLVLLNTLSSPFVPERAQGLSDQDIFNQYLDYITDYSNVDPGPVSAQKYFQDLWHHSYSFPKYWQKRFFTLLPLALSANVAPGQKDLIANQASEIIDIENIFDKGRGEYRGYFHYVPYVKVEENTIQDAGIVQQHEFKPNKKGQALNFNLSKPTSSSSVTPVSDDWMGYWDWDMVLAGYEQFLKALAEGQSQESTSGMFKRMLVEATSFYINRQIKKNPVRSVKTIQASGRSVKYELADTNPKWKPVFYQGNQNKQCVFDFRHGGRIGESGQQLAQIITHKQVPWICLAASLRFDLKAAPEKQVSLTIAGSLFPQHAVYMGLPATPEFYCAGHANNPEDAYLLFADNEQNFKDQLGTIKQARLLQEMSKTERDAIRFTDEEYGADPIRSLQPMPPFETPSDKIRTQGSQDKAILQTAERAFGDMQQQQHFIRPHHFLSISIHDREGYPIYLCGQQAYIKADALTKEVDIPHLRKGVNYDFYPANPKHCYQQLIEQVQAILHSLKVLYERLNAEKDMKYWFAQVYYYVTDFELKEVQKGTYQYPIAKLQEVIDFYRIYQRNLYFWEKEKKEAMDANWLIAFREAEKRNEGRWLETFTMEIGNALIPSIEAHVRFDLARSICCVFKKHYAAIPGAGVSVFKPDFFAMDVIFQKSDQKLSKDINRAEDKNSWITDPTRVDFLQKIVISLIDNPIYQKMHTNSPSLTGKLLDELVFAMNTERDITWKKAEYLLENPGKTNFNSLCLSERFFMVEQQNIKNDYPWIKCG